VVVALHEPGTDDLCDDDGSNHGRDVSGRGVWHDCPVPAPQYCPSPRELDDLELLLSGALAPRTTFDHDPSDPGITLALPPELADAAEVELVDPEGFPLARWTPAALAPLAHPAYGPFRRLHLTPAQAREQYAGALTVPVAAPLTDADLSAIGHTAGDRDVVLLALNGTGTPQHATPVGLLRASLAAASLLGAAGVRAHVVAAPLAAHGSPEYDHELGRQVVANYATGDVLGLTGEGEWPEEIAAIVAEDQPADAERGVVVFFTGLSGSGKSTIARALHDVLLEDGRRTVTSLDGDVVRRNLSAGLTFSRADRETNIRRIGWVAAEIARHRGVAICSPIAPFDQTRQQVRQMVDDAGGVFVLVHVATPLEECERRDRKGLYAKARAGEIPEFTGISSPYEEPADASVRIDTTGRTIEDCLAEVLPHLPFHTAVAGDRTDLEDRS
jgi:sulfate adenylyltransferase